MDRKSSVPRGRSISTALPLATVCLGPNRIRDLARPSAERVDPCFDHAGTSDRVALPRAVGRPLTGPSFASDDRPEADRFLSELLVQLDDRHELVFERPCQLVEAAPRLASLGIGAPTGQDGVEPFEPAMDRRGLAPATSSSLARGPGTANRHFRIQGKMRFISFILVPGPSSRISGWLSV